jgi:AraC-like DNA-binding protein
VSVVSFQNIQCPGYWVTILGHYYPAKTMKSVSPFPMIRARSLGPFILELQHRKVPTGQVLRQSCAPLRTEGHPDAPLPETCLWNFIENCGRVSNDKGFGFTVAKRFGLTGAGELASRLLGQKNLEAALETYLDAISSHSSESRPQLIREDQTVWIRRGTLPGKGRGFWQVEQYAVGTLLAVIKAYAGPRWKPNTIRVQAAASLTHKSALAQACHQLVGGADCAEIEIPVRLLTNAPRARPTKNATKMAPAPPFPTSFSEALTRVLDNYLGDYPLTLELASGVLGIHQRTLKRRLAAEGASFRKIRDQLQAQYARKQLRDTSASLAEISAELGYAHTPHFCRAFKRQTGLSPGAYRARA